MSQFQNFYKAFLGKSKILLLVCILILISCGCQTPQKQNPASSYEELHKSLQKENKAISKARERERELERHPREKRKKPEIEPLLPNYNPLEDVPVTLSVRQQPLPKVLNIVARNAGLNLVMDPNISPENKVTVSFQSTPSSVVVNKLLNAFDLAWSVRNNCLYVQRFQERTFDLGFLNTSTQANISSGGDIFGSSGTDSKGNNNNFSGDFSMQTSLARGDQKDSLCGYLLENVEQIIDSGGENPGEVILDSVSGDLYVRTSPNKMKTVARIVDNLKKKMKQQVVIDARILEVQLSDSFKLGIDWSFMAEVLVEDYGLNVNLGWISDTGFGTTKFNEDFEGETSSLIVESDSNADSDQYTFESTINALQTFGDISTVSNPHVRVRHNQPALITSGTTKSYIEEITREQYTENENISVSTETATAFEGMMLGVIPFITSEQKVDLQIFPINSQVDLSKRTQVGENEITLPTVDVRNVNTNVRVQDGDTIILGGLIYKQSQGDTRQTPGVGNIPILGWLFKQHQKSSRLRELVIIMHVRVI